MSNERISLLFEDNDGWPTNEWPRFLEILRAFCLSDAEQDEYFPDLKEPHYHSAMGSDGYTLNPYYPPIADAYDLCGVLWERCGEAEGEVLGHLSTLFFEATQIDFDAREIYTASQTSQTALVEMKKMQVTLRELCTEALDFFGAEKRAPQMPWDEIASQ